MKKLVVPAALFIAAFAATYLILCYHPALQIMLAAEPGEFFRESIRHAALPKAIVSGIAGVIAGCIPLLLRKRKR